MNPKVIIVGLDAATLNIIEQYADELPNFRRIISQGGTGLLLSTPNSHSASAWTSIITGKNPGKHGLFVFSDRSFTTNEQAIFTGADRKCETMYRLLARAGVKVGMINVPMTYPAESAPGCFMISGLDAPVFDERAFSPAGLRAEILERFPDYAPTPARLAEFMEAQDLDAAVNAWLQLMRVRTDAAKYLMSRYQTDLFMVVYTATDWVQHYFWKYIDKRHPDYNETEAARYQGTIKHFYQVMDGVIGELRAAVGAEANMIIISDHGMGCHNQGSFHIVEWLEQTGFLKLKQRVERAPEPEASGIMHGLERGARQAAKSLLPVSVREKIKSMVGERAAPLARKDRFYNRIIWEQTRAYSEHGRNVLNINLKGRNKFGIVEPADYERVCDELIAAVKEWRDPDTGLPVVREVRKRSEMYHGPYVDRASDMYVHWNPEVVLQRSVPPEVREKKFWWNGTHRPHGIIFCEGPAIKAGSQPLDACVNDIVPTVFRLLGVAASEDFDGRALSELLTTDDVAADVRVAARAPEITEAEESTELSEEEERDVAEKLRGLGYL